MSSKISSEQPSPDLAIQYREAERYGAISVMAIGVILLLGSLTLAGLNMSHVLPASLSHFESFAWIAAPPAIGGLALLSFGICQLIRNAEKVHKTAHELAEANVQLLLQNSDLDASRFEVVDEEGELKIQIIGIFHDALRRLRGSQEEDTEILRGALERSMTALRTDAADSADGRYAVLAAKCGRFAQTSSLLQSLAVTSGDTQAQARFERKIQPNSSGLVQPIYRQGRWYHQEHEPHHGKEAMWIFAETQLKRLGRAMTFNRHCQYFSQGETEANIYQNDPPLVTTDEPTVQNIGHATLLFQMGGLNVLTDPVFGDLNALLYPRKTRPGLMTADLPPIDVILISHNHRDHCDVESLRQLVPHQPIILVPRGDFKLFKDLGFTQVYDHDWWSSTQISHRGATFTFHAVPACHWSGRGAFDAHESLICSWVFKRDSDEGAIYFRGDTADVPLEVMDQIRTFVGGPIRANFEPGGPNHSRSLMESTHQSVLDSMLTHFDVTDQPEEGTTYLMHHNVYELGTDRFNEAVIIKDQILAFLQTDLSENDAFRALPDFVQQELRAGKLERIRVIGVEKFIHEMETHFFSPKIGQRMNLSLNRAQPANA